MRTLALLWLCLPAVAAAQETATVTVAPHGEDRRWVLAEAQVKLTAPFTVEGALAQGEGNTIRILVPFIPANQKAVFTVASGAPSGPSLSLKDDSAGFVSVGGPNGEITRYHHGALAREHMKPFWWPLNLCGVNVLRGYPLEKRAGEDPDHPHHTGMYLAYGDVNGLNYWSGVINRPGKCVPIVPVRIVKREAGPAYARLVAEHAWGEDLVETQDVTFLNAGTEVVVDWTSTLTAANGPATIGKDRDLAKEGAFAARLAAGLSVPRAAFETDDATHIISDSKGGKGMEAARASAAPWVHYRGTVDGSPLGVAMMNHPSSVRHPADWHVRNYGLFAANPWILKGPQELAKGESVVLRYRFYAHLGADEGKTAEVFAGYAHAGASAE